ncbi:MAG: hypothetical protein IJ263_10205 [Paludibacteraceae bacterium]|nr:hypothetical protein [Paludibacteraceae bacterium]
MTKKIKISVLWLLTIGGFACHSICDVLPMFWGKNMAVVATDGNVDQGMIVFMMLISFLFPVCGVLCMMWDNKATKIVNAILATLIALFNIMHACMELPAEIAGQYIIMPMLIVIGVLLAWNSVK